MKRIISLFMSIYVILALSLSLSTAAQAASTNASAGKVSTKYTALNVRKTKSSSSKIIASLKKGSYVTLISKSGNKWKVEYAPGKYGYCAKSYIKERTSSYQRYVNTKSTTLNVRLGAGSSYKVIAKLKRGKSVVVLSTKETYSKILYDGTKTGYVKTKYLSKTKPSSTYTPHKLSVTAYSQADTRWKDIKIGTQGDTIGSSGCTTTCLAMTESFRTGKTVTPKDMSKQLNYAPSGWLYWPDSYTTELVTSSNYLSKIYSLLKKGKPVILGSKKDNGSQHWVVVTGYTSNASTLEASAFEINDPGSKSRTKLSQFISAYPNLYKIAY